MTPLRQRMLEDMQLRGFSARTQECYVAAVRQLAEHFHRSPDHLTEEDLRQYFLYLANEKKVARATATIALCGIRFFFVSSRRSAASGRRSGSCVRPASTNYRSCRVATRCAAWSRRCGLRFTAPV